MLNFLRASFESPRVGGSICESPSSAPGPIFWCSWERRFGSFRTFQYPSPPFCPHPSPPLHSMKTKVLYCNVFIALLSKLVRLSPLGEGKNKKTKKYLLAFPTSPTTAQQCLNTPGDKNNLQKWSRNYIMNCPNTRHK